MGLVRAIRRAWWSILRGDFYGFLLLLVLDVSFLVLFVGGWQLDDFLYYNNLISDSFRGVFFFGGLILAFPISFYLLKRASDYFDSHGL